MLNFIVESGFFAHKDDVYTFFRRFDKDCDSRLLYSDFCDAVCPKEISYAHALNSRPPKYIHNKQIPKKNWFTSATREHYIKLFKAFFEMDEAIELSKRKVMRSPTFNIHDAFQAIDVYRDGKLTISDFKNFMQRNGYNSTE